MNPKAVGNCHVDVKLTVSRVDVLCYLVWDVCFTLYLVWDLFSRL